MDRSTARIAGRSSPRDGPAHHRAVHGVGLALGLHSFLRRAYVQTARALCCLALVSVVPACSGPVGEPDTPAATPSYDGRNRALSFDGANDYATTGTAAFPVANAPQTISAWVRATRGGVIGDASAALDAPQTLITLRKDSESGVVVGLRRGAFEAWSVFSGRTYVRASTPVMVNVWQHLAYTFDGTMHRIFVDGHQLDAGNIEPNNRTPTTGWLGSSDGAHNFFVGEIDNVWVYTVALDPSAIAVQAGRDRSTAVPVESAADLVLWLSFDEVMGSKAFDRSGRGNDALLGDGISAHMPERLLEP